MKTILICGSRYASHAMIQYAKECVVKAHQCGLTILVGDAPGIDQAVIEEADRIGASVIVFGAYGRHRNKTRAGKNVAVQMSYTERDDHMVEQANYVICVWDGQSRGTRRVYDVAISNGLKPRLAQPNA